MAALSALGPKSIELVYKWDLLGSLLFIHVFLFMKVSWTKDREYREYTSPAQDILTIHSHTHI